MKNETCHAKNKPLSLADNKCDNHIKWKLFLFPPQNPYPQQNSLASYQQDSRLKKKIQKTQKTKNQTKAKKPTKTNLNCAPKLHRALVILHKFLKLQQLLTRVTKHVGTLLKKAELRRQYRIDRTPATSI